MKLKTELPFDPAIPLLGLYPKSPETPIQNRSFLGTDHIWDQKAETDFGATQFGNNLSLETENPENRLAQRGTLASPPVPTQMSTFAPSTAVPSETCSQWSRWRLSP